VEDPLRNLRTKFFYTLLITAFTILLVGCPPRVSIEKINRDPGHYAGKEITIAGRVTSSFGAFGSGVFQLDDGTGQMWVYSRYGVPANGAKVAATGIIKQGFTFGGRAFATILERTKS
jgi:hypothetical protein